MADQGVLLIFGDVIVAHAREEVVGMVVFTDVTEAEPPIFVLARAPLGRAMGRSLRYSRATRNPGRWRATDDPGRA